MLGLEALEGEFVIRDNDEIIRLSRVRDIPPAVEKLIECAPKTPDPPQDENGHVETTKYAAYLQELTKRQRT